jgi:hypothetical protein
MPISQFYADSKAHHFFIMYGRALIQNRVFSPACKALAFKTNE